MSPSEDEQPKSKEEASSTGMSTHKPDPTIIVDNNDRIDADRLAVPSAIADDHEHISAPAPPAPGSEVDLEQGTKAEPKRKALVIIPRKDRRGLFAQLVIGIPEVEDPIQYSPRVKGFIVFIIAVAAIVTPIGYEKLLVHC
jgi:hypothetical protein